MRFLATSLLACALSSLALANPVPAPAAADEDPFHVLARDTDGSALHAALHSKKEYKHGIFPHDRGALEAVRREHEEEALKIIKFALVRRQDNGTTTDIETTTTETTTEISSTTSTTSTTPTTSIISTTTTTSEPEPETTTEDPTSEPEPETTTEDPTTATTTIITTTRTSTSTVTETETPTDATETTEEPTPTPIPTTFTRTTTFTNSIGDIETAIFTSTVYVIPPTEGPDTTATTSGPPSLVTDSAGKLELGWVHVGVAVFAGMGGWML